MLSVLYHLYTQQSVIVFMLTIELICQHAPHKCRCRHNTRTEVDRNDLTNQLIKYNPNLLKYLGKRIENQPLREHIQATVQQKQHEGQLEQPYRSIVEQKGLNFCIDDKYNQERQKIPEAKPKEQSKRSEQVEDGRVIEEIDQPREQKLKLNVKPSAKEKQVKKYHKDLRNQSRYLSDTAFRKYFNRQCFENYGRNNTQDKNDGFVYGNYMKTYNINPHTGQNIPVNEETFYRALVSGSPQKYALLTQEVKLGLTQEASPQAKKATLQNAKSLEKERLNIEKMLQDNQQHSRVKHRYEHLHLKKSLSPKNTQPQRRFQSPSQLGIHTKKQFNQQPIRVSHAESDALKQSSSAKQSLKPNARSEYIVSQEIPNIHGEKNKASNIGPQEELRKQTSINQRLQNRYVASPKSLLCDHNQTQQTVDCAACLNRMKKMMLELTQKDPELAERMINSAKKSVLYKNYALNNFQNAAMNPHNYRREDGRLNIYDG